jgi:hypothetical protein
MLTNLTGINCAIKVVMKNPSPASSRSFFEFAQSTQKDARHYYHRSFKQALQQRNSNSMTVRGNPALLVHCLARKYTD